MKIVFTIIMLLFLTGFKYKVKESGYVDFNNRIEKGFVKNQVKLAMGNPSVISDFDNKWYYINTLIVKDVFGLRKIFSAKVIEISFDDDKVGKIKKSSVSQKKLPKINSDSSIITDETLSAKIVRALKRLNPSL